jgi:hypothetical protein
VPSAWVEKRSTAKGATRYRVRFSPGTAGLGPRRARRDAAERGDGLADRNAPAAPWLVHVAPAEPFELAEPQPGRIQHQQREAVTAGEEAVDGLD